MRAPSHCHCYWCSRHGHCGRFRMQKCCHTRIQLIVDQTASETTPQSTQEAIASTSAPVVSSAVPSISSAPYGFGNGTNTTPAGSTGKTKTKCRSTGFITKPSATFVPKPTSSSTISTHEIPSSISSSSVSTYESPSSTSSSSSSAGPKTVTVVPLPAKTGYGHY